MAARSNRDGRVRLAARTDSPVRQSADEAPIAQRRPSHSKPGQTCPARTKRPRRRNGRAHRRLSVHRRRCPAQPADGKPTTSSKNALARSVLCLTRFLTDWARSVSVGASESRTGSSSSRWSSFRPVLQSIASSDGAERSRREALDIAARARRGFIRVTEPYQNANRVGLERSLQFGQL